MAKIIDITSLQEIKDKAQDSVIFKNTKNSIYYLGLDFISSLSLFCKENYSNLELKFAVDCSDSAAIAFMAIRSKIFDYVIFNGSNEFFELLSNISSLTTKVVRNI